MHYQGQQGPLRLIGLVRRSVGGAHGHPSWDAMQNAFTAREKAQNRRFFPHG